MHVCIKCTHTSVMCMCLWDRERLTPRDWERERNLNSRMTRGSLQRCFTLQKQNPQKWCTLKSRISSRTQNVQPISIMNTLSTRSLICIPEYVVWLFRRCLHCWTSFWCSRTYRQVHFYKISIIQSSENTTRWCVLSVWVTLNPPLIADTGWD